MVLKFIFFSNYMAKVTLFVDIGLSLVLKLLSITLKNQKNKRNYFSIRGNCTFRVKIKQD